MPSKTRIDVTIGAKRLRPQYCYYLLIALIWISLAVAQQNSAEDVKDNEVKRAAQSHNIMRFGRGGHSIMHFGKRKEMVTVGDNFADSEPDIDSDEQRAESDLYQGIGLRSDGRSPSTRYLIPHGFIASLYSRPRSFLKKASDNRDSLFMHFG